MEVKFFDFKNHDFNGMVVVATSYSGNIEELLSSYYNEVTEVTPCAKSAHYMELFTSYSEVNLEKRLAIWEKDNDGISSCRQPSLGSLL